MRDFIKQNISKKNYEFLKRIWFFLISFFNYFIFIYKKVLGNRVKTLRNRKKAKRYLEIGPGNERIPGFETLNIVAGKNVDYVYDAAKKLPFKEDSFVLIYSSHILEHIPWYKTKDTLEEWYRILKPGGQIEIWVPDGKKIAKAFIDAEEGYNYINKDGWYRFNPEKDPCKWAAGRMYTYGDGKGTLDHPNWHRALFSERYLKKVLREVGFVDLQTMSKNEVRGGDHGWINLGVKGTKNEL